MSNVPKELFGVYSCPACGCKLDFDGTAGAANCPECNASLDWEPLPPSPEMGAPEMGAAEQ